MGGVTKYPFPHRVWSPAGGWWRSRPGHWSGATLAAGGIVFTVAVLVFEKSRRLEEWNRSGAYAQSNMSMGWNLNKNSPHREQ